MTQGRRGSCHPPASLSAARDGIRPVGSAHTHHLLVGDGRQEISDRDVDPEVGASAPRQEAGVELGDRLEGETPLVEARMRHDEVVLRIGDASAIEGQDVEVDGARAPSARLGVPAKRELEAFQLREKLDGLEVGLELESRIEEMGLVEVVARRAVIEGRHLDHLADGPQLSHGCSKGDGRFAYVSPEADEAAHGVRTLVDTLRR